MNNIPCWHGPEPYIPGPGRRKPSPPVVSVNGQRPDENGNVTVVFPKTGLVQSVNGYGPNAQGAVRIPRKFSGYGAPVGAAGYIEGDSYFDTQNLLLYHFVLVGTALRWVEQRAGSEASVTSVNGQTGDVVLPEEETVSSHPVSDVMPVAPEGYSAGDSMFCTSDNSRWVLVRVTGGGYRWVRQDHTDAASVAIGELAAWLDEHDVMHMKDSEKTALLQKLVAYVKAKEGI